MVNKVNKGISYHSIFASAFFLAIVCGIILSCSHHEAIPRCYELEADVERMKSELPKVLEPGVTLTNIEYEDTTYTMWYEVDESVIPFEDYIKIKDESKALVLDSLYFADGETRANWYKFLEYHITCKYVMIGKHSQKKVIQTITPQEMEAALNMVVDSTDIIRKESLIEKKLHKQVKKEQLPLETTLQQDNKMGYNYNGHYRIILPNIIELQESELNSVSIEKGESNQLQVQSNSNRIVFQQRGLNVDMESAYRKYCRVIIEYYEEDRDNPVFSQGEQIYVTNDLIQMLHQSSKAACNMNKTPMIKFNSPQTMTINGYPVLYYSYKRRGYKNQPPVIVNIYNIYNRYESVTLTFSYREAERDLWKDIHNYIKKTFSFNKTY